MKTEKGPASNLLRVAAVAERLSLSRSGVYSLMDKGLLAYVKLGKSRRIPAEAVDRLIEESTVGAQ
jgi:excisionase family DNA binding protein